jgi:glycosyltransferase involved in cell wall biosynthesis
MNILATGMGWIEHTPGGLNRYFADYLDAMRRQGHHVQGLITAGGERTSAPDYMADVIRHPSKSSTLNRTTAFRRAFLRELHNHSPDVYNPHFSLYSSMITRGLVPSSVPIVTHFHGPWAEESLVEDQGGRIGQQLRYRVKKMVEQLSYRRSDRFIVLSQYFHDVLSGYYGADPERIHIIPGATDIERFRPSNDREALRKSLGIEADQRVLFCARRLMQRMGIENLIRSMAEVLRKAPNTLLFIAGAGPLRSTLEQLIGELGLGRSIRLLGRVSNEELVSWYQASDFSVVPTIALEGFGLVTVEALACGTPVLGTPYGGTLEILEPFSPSLLFRDSSPGAMAERLVAVLTGEEAVPTREQCREHVLERYTWDRVAQSVTNVFELALEERKGLEAR